MDILDIKPTDALEDFLDLYASVDDIDKDKARDYIKKTLKFYSNPSDNREHLLHEQILENKWYDKLENENIPWYDVYGEKYYFTNTWCCWVIYSRLYLKAIGKENSMFDKSILSHFGDLKSIADLGCGISYTTAALKQLYPEANVSGVNLRDTVQWKLCEKMSKKHGFEMKGGIDELGQTDLVFASEYFEHIYDAGDHLIDVIEKLSPKHLVMANAFNTRSIGHFWKYGNEKIRDSKKGIAPGHEIGAEKMGRLFTRILNDRGYKKQKTKLWNNRPQIWSKIESPFDAV